MKDSFKELTFEELLVKREELRKQYGDVSFNAIIGHLDNPLSKRSVRRRLARANTIIREYELGIRQRQTPPTASSGKGTAAGPASSGKGTAAGPASKQTAPKQGRRAAGPGEGA
jgi:large subunit ribosomal protein L29